MEDGLKKNRAGSPARQVMSTLAQAKPYITYLVRTNCSAKSGVYASAVLLAEKFERVVVLTPSEVIARADCLVARQSAYKRLFEAGVEIIPWSELDAQPSLEDGVVGYANVMTGRLGTIKNVTMLTYATPKTPDLSLLPALTASGITVKVIGDAYMPRSTVAVVREGHEAGFEVGRPK
ncbi:MAG: hypothetical protein IIB31_10380 [Chloroflexi bacterium]|nr:hypothetical protein [Chloroflexota bacterium]